MHLLNINTSYCYSQTFFVVFFLTSTIAKHTSFHYVYLIYFGTQRPCNLQVRPWLSVHCQRLMYTGKVDTASAPRSTQSQSSPHSASYFDFNTPAVICNAAVLCYIRIYLAIFYGILQLLNVEWTSKMRLKI